MLFPAFLFLKRVMILCSLFIFINKNSYAQNHKLDSLKKALKALKEDTNYVNTAVELAFILEDSRPDSALYVAKNALEIAQKNNFYLGIRKALFRVAYAYQALGRNDKAWENYEQHLYVSEKHKDTIRIGRSYYALGYLCKILGRYPQSLEYFKKCVDFYQKINDTKGLVRGYNSLGSVAIDLKNTQEAVAYFKQSLHLAQKIKDVRGQAFALKNLGELDYENKNIHLAKNKWETALTFVQSPANVLPRLELMNLLAKCYVENPENRAEINRKIAILYLESILKEQHNKDIKVLYEIEKAYSQYGEIFKVIQPTLAYQYAQKSRNLKDSLSKIEKIQQLVSLSMNFEADMQQRKFQIIQAQKDNEFLIQQYFFQAIIVGLLGGFFCLGYIYWLKRKTQKQTFLYNQQLLELNKEKEKMNGLLKELNIHLEDKIHERTLTLAELNAKLTHYAFINAHKLRSPVATIMGLLILIKESPQEATFLLNMLEITVAKLDGVTREIQQVVDSADFNEIIHE